MGLRAVTASGAPTSARPAEPAQRGHTDAPVAQALTVTDANTRATFLRGKADRPEASQESLPPLPDTVSVASSPTGVRGLRAAAAA